MINRKLQQWSKQRKRHNEIQRQHHINARDRPKEPPTPDLAPETLGWLTRLMLMVRGPGGNHE